MTIHEASLKWNISEKTILTYISKGYIYNLSIINNDVNNEISIPDIPKPYIRKKPSTIPDKDRYILKSLEKELYINATIMGINQNQFEERLKELLRVQKITKRKQDICDYTSNLNFILAPNTNKFTMPTSVTIDMPVKIQVADQIALVAGKIEK